MTIYIYIYILLVDQKTAGKFLKILRVGPPGIHGGCKFRPPGIQGCKFFEHLVSGLPFRLYQFCRVELTAWRLRVPIQGMPTWPSIFGTLTCMSSFVRSTLYKMALCCILAWWEVTEAYRETPNICNR